MSFMGENFEESSFPCLELNYDPSVVHYEDRNCEISNIPCSCEHFLFIFAISLLIIIYNINQKIWLVIFDK